ncbi:MAG: TlpA family protein disulfide reductase [Pirellulales bacterium]
MKIIAVVALVLLLPFGCNSQQTPAPRNETAKVPTSEPVEAAPAEDSVSEGTPADGVTVEIKDFDGIQELIAGKRGKVVVMDCWSTWCEPCVKEFPGLVKLHEKYGDKVACISLSFNYAGGKNESPEDHQEAVLEFLRSQHATFDNVLASVPDEELYQRLGFKSAAVPAIFVYDREGNLVGQFESAEAKYSEVEKLVGELIEKP